MMINGCLKQCLINYDEHSPLAFRRLNIIKQKNLN